MALDINKDWQRNPTINAILPKKNRMDAKYNRIKNSENLHAYPKKNKYKLNLKTSQQN